ncbi:MAG TPA: efflux RND transporter periplasmic adaptor subunit [Propionicimonas sp.]|nr:efflux RND transporter periplasmic adaptor subunit [Propionicimonas sp.]
MSEPVPEAAPESETPPRRKRRRMTRGRWVALALAVVLLAGGGTAAFLLLRPQETAQATTRTFSAEAELSTQTVTVGLTGTLAPRTQSDLNFTVSGTVTRVWVSAGDTVTKGERLARVDDSDLRDALVLAKADLQTAIANLDDVEDDDDSSSASITAAAAQVKSARAAVTSAREDLDDAVLRSTINGTVASVDLSVGDTVSSSSGSQSGASTTSTTTSSSSQVVVISTNKWLLNGTVGSADLASLTAGQAVAITPDGASEALDGEVTSVGIVSTGTSDGAATFPVEITISGKHTDLYSGTTAAAVITVGEYPDVLTIPTAAISASGEKSVVTRVTGDATEVVEVGVGKVFGNATEITSGLSEGDTVQISFTRPVSTDTTSTEGEEQGGGLFGTGGGGFAGGGAPPAGGMPPGGSNR